MAEYLTYREAAKVTRRSVVTIKRWRRNGMPMGWEMRDGQRHRVVDERILKTWWRERMTADPVWQARLRKMRREREEATRRNHDLPSSR
ncbi:hypothetical protein [Microbacterium soli]|uniref:Helix-turn-helix domain-containing protein n=1 Tax=Microbacterium soli TaxID=446075 RepID=A0ABP7NIN9_9MICO